MAPPVQSAAPSVNAELLDRAIRHAVYLERLKSHEAARVLGLFEAGLFPELLALVERRLDRVRLRGYDSGVTDTGRYQAMIEDVRALVREKVAAFHADLRTTLGTVAVAEAKWQVAALDRAFSIAFDFEKPSPGLLRSIAKSQPMEGKVLREWVAALEQGLAARVQQAINVGLAQGEPVEAIVRRLKGTKLAGYADGILNRSRREIEGVVRSYVGHVTNHANEAVYRANQDVIKGVQWVGTLDARTCRICAALDGKVLDIDEGIRPPAHLSCRCRTIPITKSWKELGIRLKEAPEGTRASMNGEVPASTTYGTWLGQQSAAFQDDVLGPTLGKLFRSGELDVSDFIDARGRMLTVAEILEKEGLTS